MPGMHSLWLLNVTDTYGSPINILSSELSPKMLWCTSSKKLKSSNTGRTTLNTTWFCKLPLVDMLWLVHFFFFLESAFLFFFEKLTSEIAWEFLQMNFQVGVTFCFPLSIWWSSWILLICVPEIHTYRHLYEAVQVIFLSKGSIYF